MKIILASLYPYAFMLLYLIIPFDDYVRILPNILFGLLIITFPFIVKKEDFKKLRKIPTLLFILFFAYLLVNSLFSERLEGDFKILKKVVVAIGLVLLYIPIQDFKKIKRAIVFSSLAAILFSIINILVLSITSGDFEIENTSFLIEGLLVDRLYLGLLSVVSILVSAEAIKTKYHPNNNYNLANISINTVFILLIGSKISIFILILLVMLRQLYGKRKIVKVLAALIFSMVLSVFIISISNSKNPIESDDTGSALTHFISNTVTWEVRTLVWKCSIKIAKTQGLIVQGLGFEKTKEELVSCYETTIQDPLKKESFINERYNTHNEFFDLYISFGVVALLLLLVFLAWTFMQNRRDYILTATLLTLIMFAMVENLFHRQIGVYYVGLFLIFLLFNSSDDQNNTLKEV